MLFRSSNRHQMAAKLTRKLNGARERRERWRFDIRLTQCDGLGELDKTDLGSGEVCVQLARHAKVAVSPCAAVAGGRASWAADAVLSLVCTLKPHEGGSFDPKPFKLTLLQQRGVSSGSGQFAWRRAIASCEIDLAAFTAAKPVADVAGGVTAGGSRPGSPRPALRVLKLAQAHTQWRGLHAAQLDGPQLTLSVKPSPLGRCADDDITSVSSQILGNFSLERSIAAAATATAAMHADEHDLASYLEQDLGGFDETESTCPGPSLVPSPVRVPVPGSARSEEAHV